jgi:hypothetical protein
MVTGSKRLRFADMENLAICRNAKTGPNTARGCETGNVSGVLECLNYAIYYEWLRSRAEVFKTRFCRNARGKVVLFAEMQKRHRVGRDKPSYDTNAGIYKYS